MGAHNNRIHTYVIHAHISTGDRCMPCMTHKQEMYTQYRQTHHIHIHTQTQPGILRIYTESAYVPTTLPRTRQTNSSSGLSF